MCLFSGYKQNVKLNFQRSGSYNKFQSCHDRMDMVKYGEKWGSEILPHLGCEHKNKKWKIKVFLSLVESWSGWESNSMFGYNVLYTLKVLVVWNNLILVTSLIIALRDHGASERSNIEVAALFNSTPLDSTLRHTTYNIFHRPQINCLISAGITVYDWRWMYRTSVNRLQT